MMRRWLRGDMKKEKTEGEIDDEEVVRGNVTFKSV